MVAYTFSEYVQQQRNNEISESLLSESVSSIKADLKKLGFSKFKDLTKKRFAVLVDGNRITARDKILDTFSKTHNATLDMSKSAVSSIGIIVTPGAEIVVKNANRQGNRSAGIENEIYIINTLNKALADADGPMDVVFEAGRKKILCKDVTSVLEMGRDTSGRKKADIVLKGKQDYPISLKKDNAGAWESSDRKFGEAAGKIVRELVKDGKVELQDLPGGLKRMTPEVAVPISDRNAIDVIFGSDLQRGGGVVVRTFQASDFDIDFTEGLIAVKSSAIITTLRDVKGTDKEPVVIIRNDKSRSSRLIGIPGLRVLVNQKSRVSRKTYKVKNIKL